MSGAQRVDVPSGSVPTYREFVRHLWRYEDPKLGPCLKPPPMVYRFIVEDAGEELEVTSKVREEVLVCYELAGDSIEIERDGSAVAHGVSFRSVEALHLFAVHLAAMAKYRKAARALGDFLMWSLGFRWV